MLILLARPSINQIKTKLVRNSQYQCINVDIHVLHHLKFELILNRMFTITLKRLLLTPTAIPTFYHD